MGHPDFTGNWVLATDNWFMTWIKICGMTNLEDALVAVEAGADAVGFVFYEKSPRCVSVEVAREIVAKLPEEVEKVGVFVDADCDRIRSVVLQAGLTAVQLHGKRSMDSVWQDARSAIECIGVSKLIPMIPGNALKDGGILISERVHERTFAVLIDSQVNGMSGGTGAVWDWEATHGMVQSLGFRMPVIVAGGLTPANVREAVALFQPFGVDVASGVETRPGKKDAEKVRAFVRAARGMDRRTS
ncbi:MAG: phosphoribosylanthranilate isomerase [Candidatus Sulfotelmatobacter sp.]|jgi:phosphoribosylanthranilate isomerase